MSNLFDQFDGGSGRPSASSSNPFDQFDSGSSPAQRSSPAQPEPLETEPGGIVGFGQQVVESLRGALSPVTDTAGAVAGTVGDAASYAAKAGADIASNPGDAGILGLSGFQSTSGATAESAGRYVRLSPAVRLQELQSAIPSELDRLQPGLTVEALVSRFAGDDGLLDVTAASQFIPFEIADAVREMQVIDAGIASGQIDVNDPNLLERAGESAKDAANKRNFVVDPEFAESEGGQVASALGGSLPMMAGPAGPVMGAGAMADQQHQDYKQSMAEQGLQMTPEGEVDAMTAGLALAPLEYLPIGRIVARAKRLMPAGKEGATAALEESLATFADRAKQYGKDVAQGAIEEGLTEFLQGVGQNVIARDVLSYDEARAYLGDDLDEQTYAGMTVGALMSAMLGAPGLAAGGRPAAISDAAEAPGMAEQMDALNDTESSQAAQAEIQTPLAGKRVKIRMPVTNDQGKIVSWEEGEGDVRVQKSGRTGRVAQYVDYQEPNGRTRRQYLTIDGKDVAADAGIEVTEKRVGIQLSDGSAMRSVQQVMADQGVSAVSSPEAESKPQTTVSRIIAESRRARAERAQREEVNAPYVGLRDQMTREGADADARKGRVDPERDDLLTAIAKMGGLDPDSLGGEVDIATMRSMQRVGQPIVRGQGQGKTLDHMSEILMEQGYVAPDGSPLDPNSLVDLIDSSSRGEAFYSQKSRRNDLIDPDNAIAKRWFGGDRTRVMHALQKHIDGKPLTPNQQNAVDDLTNILRGGDDSIYRERELERGRDMDIMRGEIPAWFGELQELDPEGAVDVMQGAAAVAVARDYADGSIDDAELTEHVEAQMDWDLGSYTDESTGQAAAGLEPLVVDLAVRAARSGATDEQIRSALSSGDAAEAAGALMAITQSGGNDGQANQESIAAIDWEYERDSGAVPAGPDDGEQPPAAAYQGESGSLVRADDAGVKAGSEPAGRRRAQGQSEQAEGGSESLTPADLDTDRRTPHADRRASVSAADAADRYLNGEELTPEEINLLATMSEVAPLPNKRAFQRVWREHERRAASDPSYQMPLVVSMDADSLKWVNDNLGHEAGDLMLNRIGQSLADVTDDAFHLSGDEFAMIVPSAAVGDELKGKAQAILDAQGYTFEGLDGKIYRIERFTLTHGIGANIKAADAEMTKVKEQKEAAGERASRGEQPSWVKTDEKADGRSADPQAESESRPGETGQRQDAAGQELDSPPPTQGDLIEQTPADAGVSVSGDAKAKAIGYLRFLRQQGRNLSNPTSITGGIHGNETFHVGKAGGVKAGHIRVGSLRTGEQFRLSDLIKEIDAAGMTVDEAVRHRVGVAQREIEKDIADGVVPGDVSSFSGLHDHVDANMYVNDADREDRVFGPAGKAAGFKPQDFADHTGRMIDALDSWLAGGRKGNAVDFIDRDSIDAMAHAAATSPENDLPEPSEAQIEAGNYPKGHIRVGGLDISIENPRGSVRRGTDPDGNAWEQELAHHYGYIKRTEGADGEHVDVFVGKTVGSEKVFIVDQLNADGSFDEHKIMLGFTSKAGARKGYRDNYQKGWKVGPITEMSLGDFKAWLDGGDTRSPVDESLASKPAGTAPEHSAKHDDLAGLLPEELTEMVAAFEDAGPIGGGEGVTGVFDPPKKSEIVRLADKAKVYTKEHGWMTREQAKAVIDEWKANAAKQYDENRSENSRKVVLSFFDYTGEWSKPWEEAGYQVYRFDIQNDPEVGDVNNFSTEFFNDWFGDFDGMDVYAVLAACPCTDFAVSGARHFAAKDADGRTIKSVRLVHKTLAAIEYFRPPVWALENPVGRIEKLGGLPPWRLGFDPNHLGETYTKKTLIWGRFNADLPIAPMDPVEGSKMHQKYGGKSMATKNARSATPEGFSYAFFHANNAVDHPVMAVSNKYDQLDRSAIETALSAGITPDEIDSIVSDFYYMDLDYEGANQALLDEAALRDDQTPAEQVDTAEADRQYILAKKAMMNGTSVSAAWDVFVDWFMSGEGKQGRFEYIFDADIDDAPRLANALSVFATGNRGIYTKIFSREIPNDIATALGLTPVDYEAEVVDDGSAAAEKRRRARTKKLRGQDVIVRSNGRQWTSRSSAESKLRDWGLQNTHYVRGLDGKYDLVRLPDVEIPRGEGQTHFGFVWNDGVDGGGYVFSSLPAKVVAAWTGGKVVKWKESMNSGEGGGLQAPAPGTEVVYVGDPESSIDRLYALSFTGQERLEALMDEYPDIVPPSAGEPVRPPVVDRAAAPAEKDGDFGASNKLVTKSEADDLIAQLKGKFGRANSGVDPTLLADLTKVAVYYIEAGVRSFPALLRKMAEHFGEDVLPYMRSMYEGARYYPGMDADGMTAPASIDEMMVKTAGMADNKAKVDAILATETSNESGTRGDLERDRQDAAPADGVGADSVPTQSERAGRQAGSGVPKPVTAEGGRQGNRRPADGEAASGGEPGNLGLDFGDEFSGSEAGASRSDGPGRSRPAGRAGARPQSEAGRPAEKPAAESQVAPSQKRAQQDAANAIPVVLGNSSNVAQTLPYLLADQLDDVRRIEARLINQDHAGILVTNGTGTGKTYTGGGTIARFYRAGKTEQLIVVPSQAKAEDWINDMANLGMSVNLLDGIRDQGAPGINITTYANFSQNMELLKREWDLVTYDESHRLNQNQDNGGGTTAQNFHFAHTNKPGYMLTKVSARDPRYMQAYYQRAENEKSILQDLVREFVDENGREPDSRYLAMLQLSAKNKAKDKFQEAIKPFIDELIEKSKVMDVEQPHSAKVQFLSATPFGYHFNLDYAAGYLFSFGDEDGLSYNSGNGRDLFYMSAFGYRMRYNKLTIPESGVDVNLMERMLHEQLKKEGAIISRQLDVPFDYSRDFITFDDELGRQIDMGIKIVQDMFSFDDDVLRDVLRRAYTHAGMDPDTVPAEPEDMRRDPLLPKFDQLAYNAKRHFSYSYVAQLREAVLARHMVERIEKHLAQGRKVVLFHDFRKAPASHPFKFSDFRAIPSSDEATQIASQRQLERQIDTFHTLFPEMAAMDLSRLRSVDELVLEHFESRARTFNGTVSDKSKKEAKRVFNDHDSGVDVIAVQRQSGKEGLSLHDVKGDMPRALLDLGLPIRPTDAIQTEGRTYRMGQQSNAIFEYPVLNLSFEQRAFAQKVAERARTPENLAMGDMARDLEMAFKEGYQNADATPVSASQGTGGKERDRTIVALSDFEKAKTYYFANQKNTKRRDQREGKDYFATPEPLGFKMVEWLDARPNDRLLEPSAGHGAIARFFPGNARNTFVEPAPKLSARLGLNATGEIKTHTFENLHIGNKYEGIAMNPPFGAGGSEAVTHLAKAARHLADGGRVVAIIPTGPAADKKLDAWLYGDDAKDIYQVASIRLPAVTFERAGTSVAARLLVLERHSKPESAPEQMSQLDLSHLSTIGEFFDRIGDLELPPRRAAQAAPDAEESSVKASASAPPADPAAATAASAKMGGFGLHKFVNSRTGEPVFLAMPVDRVSRDEYGRVLAVAKQHDGWYNSYQNASIGAKRGFAFKSEQARSRFLDDLNNGVQEDGALYSLAPAAVRTDWQEGFPRVLVMNSPGAFQRHPDYHAAKFEADLDAADRLTRHTITDSMIAELETLAGDAKPILVPVQAIEGRSPNHIPLAAAAEISHRLGWPVERSIVQTVQASRSDGDGFYRLMNQPQFDGVVKPGKEYLLIDDTLTQGGTLAALKGFIESRGGRVVGAAAMEGKQYSSRLALSGATLEALKQRWPELEGWWNDNFPYKLEQLTESEARYLERVRVSSFAELRDRLTAAQRGGRLSVPEPEEGRALTATDTEKARPSAGLSASGLRKSLVGALGDRLAGAVKVVQSVADLPLSTRGVQEIQSAGAERVEGMYDQSTGDVYLVADSMASEDRAAWVAWHELWHRGVRVSGGRQLSELLQRADMNSAVSGLADAIAAERGLPAGQRMIAVEEALAELNAADETGNYGHIESRYGVKVPRGLRAGVRGHIARFLGRVRAILRALGIGRNAVLDHEVFEIITGARAGYERGNPEVQRQVREEAAADGNWPRQRELFDQAPAAVKKTFEPRVESFLEATGSITSQAGRLTSPAAAAAFLRPYSNYAHETMLVVPLDSAGNPMGVIRHTKGSATGVSVYAEVIAGELILAGAHSYWISHNHPSGNPVPSQPDLSITRRINEFVDGLGIKMRGHIVLGSESYSLIDVFGEDADGARYPDTLGEAVTVKVYERLIRRLLPDSMATVPLDGPASAVATIRDLGLENSSGAFVMNAKFQIVRVAIFEGGNPERLRPDIQSGGTARKFLEDVVAGSPEAVIPFSPTRDGAINLSNLLASVSPSVLDVIYEGDKSLLTVTPNAKFAEPALMMSTAAAYSDARHHYRAMMESFLEILPENASADDVIESIAQFPAPLQRVIRALSKDGWLGFDYPAQALDAMFSEDADQWEMSPGLKSAIGAYVNSGTGLYSLAPKNTAEIGETEAGKRKGKFTAGILSQPIDRMFRLPFDAMGMIDAHGRLKGGVKLTEAAKRAITSWRPHPEGRFAWMDGLLETARAGLIDRYGLSDEYKRRWREAEAEERIRLTEGLDFLKTLQDAKVGLQEARVLHAVLTGEQIAEGDWAGLAEPIRRAIDDLGQELVSLGLLSAEAYQRNRGTYLHRSYMKHEAQFTPISKWVNGLMTKRRRRIVGNELKGRGIDAKVHMGDLRRALPEDWWGARMERGQADLSLKDARFILFEKLEPVGAGTETLPGMEEGGRRKPRVLDRHYWPADLPVPEKYQSWENRGDWQVRAVKGSDVVLWRDYTKAERERMGEIVDARYAIAKTFEQLSHDIAMGRFFSDIAKNPEWFSRDEPAGNVVDAATAGRMSLFTGVDWVRVPEGRIPNTSTSKWGAMAGGHVRAEIWRDLNELDRMHTTGVWGQILTQWKQNKTSRSPVVHMNNVMSNLMFMDLADVRMTDLVRGIHAYANQTEEYNDAIRHGAFEGSFVTQEVRRRVLQPILDEIMEEHAGGATGLVETTSLLGKILDGLASGIKKFDDITLDLYQMEDELFRMATYMRRLEMGDTPEAAATMAREQFLDYDIRAPWVNMARRTVLPFISYTYRAVPVVAQSVAHRPWKLAKYFTLAQVWLAMAYAMAPGDEDEEQRTLTEEKKGYTWIGVPRMIRMPYRDENNNPVFLDIRRWIPAGDVFDTYQGTMGGIGIPAPLQLGGPLMMGAELALNKAAFTGDEIYDPLTDTAGDKAANIAGWAYKSWMPSAAYIPGSWYWDKLWTAAQGGRDYSGQPYSVPQAFMSSLGVKLQPHDVEMNKYYYSLEFSAKKRELRGKMTQLARDLERGLIDRGAYDKGRKKLEDQMRRVAEEAQGVITGE